MDTLPKLVESKTYMLQKWDDPLGATGREPAPWLPPGGNWRGHALQELRGQFEALLAAELDLPHVQCMVQVAACRRVDRIPFFWVARRTTRNTTSFFGGPTHTNNHPTFAGS